MKMQQPQDGQGQEKWISRRPGSCPGFRSPAATTLHRRLLKKNGNSTTTPMLSSFFLGPILMIVASIVMAGHPLCVVAYVPSTPPSQHASTNSIPQPLRKLRPCHDINSDDPLFVLGLTTVMEPSKDDIKRAYKNLVTFYHPDVLADLHTVQAKQEANTRFAKINAAYREALAQLTTQEERRHEAAREQAQRLAELEKLGDNPFNWALRTASMNKDHVTAQSRFEYIAWKLGQQPSSSTVTATGSNAAAAAATGRCDSESVPAGGQSSRRPSVKVHIRRRTHPMPDKTVDPFTWATSVNTGL